MLQNTFLEDAFLEDALLEDDLLNRSLEQIGDQEPLPSAAAARGQAGQEADESPTASKRQKRLTLSTWEQGERRTGAAPAAKPKPSGHPRVDPYDAAVALLLLTSLSAIIACFVRIN